MYCSQLGIPGITGNGLLIMSYTIGIDIGTTNLCAVLVDSATYSVENMTSCKNDALLAGGSPAAFEQDAAVILERLLSLLARLVAESAVAPEAITDLAITGQMHGILLVDGKLEVKSSLYTWRDRRSEESGFLEGIVGLLPEDYTQRTGCRLAAGFGGLTLAWLLARGELEVEAEGCTVLTIMDYLAAVLTGRRAIDYSNAAGWGIFDITENCWYEAMLDILKIPTRLLPEVLNSSEAVGTLLPRQAEKLGLQSELRVWVPIGDNQASYYGASKGRNDVAVINIGTSGQITVPSTSISIANGLETRPLPNAGYILVGAILCGGWSYDYLARFFLRVITELGGVELDKDLLYSRMRELLEAEYTQGGAGLKVSTRFSGSRSGQGEQTGSIYGIDEGNLTPGNMIYGFLRGIIEELFGMLPCELIGSGSREIHKLVATGNAIRLNPEMLKIIEDVFGVKCRLSDSVEEAAAGAAYVAISNAGR